MRRIVTIALALALSAAGTANAVDVTLDFESYATGALAGQDGWTCCALGTDASGFVVTDAKVSPLNGSTKSIQINGVPGSSNRIFRPVTPISTGIYQVGYDFTHSGQSPTTPTNMVMRVIFYTEAHASQIIQPYAQNGGGGAAAFNGFFDRDALGTAPYGGTGMGIGGLQPNQWYRLEFIADFDNHLIYDIISYDLSSGQKVMVDVTPGPLFFQNNGTDWQTTFGELGLGFGPSSADESWNFDNFSAVEIADPADLLLTFEPSQNYAPGLLIGQNGWGCCALGSDSSGFNVDTTIRSPYFGSTQAAKIGGPTTADRAFYPLPAPIGTGHYQAAYDFTHSGQSPTTPSNMVMRVPFYTTAHASQLIQPYAQNGGGGAAAFNGFFDTDGVGGNAYGGTGMGAGGLLPESWYRLEFFLDFDNHIAYNIRSYSLDPNNGNKTLIGTNNGPLYFNNLNTGDWQLPFGELGLGFGPSSADEWWAIDNVSVLQVPRPPPIIAEVRPDPQHIVVGSSYSQQLSLIFDFLPATWSVVDGPTGLTVSETGLVGGWTPTAEQVGSSVTITIQANSFGGSDTETWNVVVNAVPTVDGTNVAEPWGTVHGNLAGTQSSNASGLVFDAGWANGVSQEWALDLSTGNLGPATERGGITFDESANLYWRTSTGYLASVAPDGTDRWSGFVGHDGGTPVVLGMPDSSTPVVGGGGPTGRVYVLSDEGVVAFQKSNGQRLWSVALPDSGFAASDDRLTPVLYNGILYVVGAGGSNKVVYAINASNGEIIWDTLIDVNLDLGWGDAKGAMAFVPNVFGAGSHGLYFNADGTGANASDVYALKIGTVQYGGKLEWAANGGKSAHSHPVYSATTNRIYTDTWGDDGNTFYAFDPATGAVKESNTSEGSGYNDFAALDFNGTDVLVEAGAGHVWRYHDTGDGTTTSAFYLVGPLFGEFRMYGGLYQNTAGDSILLGASRGPGEEVFAFNATTEPTGGGQVTMLFNYPTSLLGGGEDYIRGLQLGPAVGGARQKIYFFQGAGSLVALGFAPPIPGDFDNNGFVDAADLDLFVDCVMLGNGPEIPIAGEGCQSRDLDSDGDIDQSDYAIWQRCFNGENPGDPNCAD